MKFLNMIENELAGSLPETWSSLTNVSEIPSGDCQFKYQYLLFPNSFTKVTGLVYRMTQVRASKILHEPFEGTPRYIYVYTVHLYMFTRPHFSKTR